MDNYIDIHCHILPQLDDGSKSIEQTINMLRIAYREGIRTIIATPHFHEGMKETSLLHMYQSLKRVDDEIAKTMPQMTIHLGCEVYYSHESIKLLNNKYIPTLANSRYVLVEFSPFAEYKYIKNSLQELIMEGYYPILAHVERYKNLVKQWNLIRELTYIGVYYQMNANSIIGGSGRACQRLSKKLLKYKLIHFIGTDSHNDKSRAPVLKKCIKYIVKKYGEAYVNELLVNNPNKILLNKYM